MQIDKSFISLSRLIFSLFFLRELYCHGILIETYPDLSRKVFEFNI